MTDMFEIKEPYYRCTFPFFFFFFGLLVEVDYYDLNEFSVAKDPAIFFGDSRFILP